MKIYDISQEVFSSAVYPGDPKPEKQTLNTMKNGDLYNLSAFSMCAHNGTHVDAPLHFIADGASVDQMNLDIFVGECYVAAYCGDISAEGAKVILQKADGAQRILISGDAVITAEAAAVFAESGIKLIGNEGQTVGPENAPMEVHKIFLSRGIALLEGIVLENVPEDRYFLSAAPLNLAGAEGAPCRAYLIAW